VNKHTFYLGNTLDVLRTLPDESVHCCVTSPPYWGLRDYGVEGQIGLEPTPDEYVAKMVEVFREVRRVLRDDGTLWLNLGDSYASKPPGCDGVSYSSGLHGAQGDTKYRETLAKSVGTKRNTVVGNLKPKDLIGIPWRVAFALQADGWYLRSDIIWAKPNPMPESVTDRPTRSHEHIFLLTKSQRYFYDHVAIQEKSATGTGESGKFHRAGPNSRNEPLAMRNKRDVWTVATQPFPGAHFAVFPESLIEPCILAGTSERGCCPKCGSPWERITEKQKATNTKPRPFAKRGNNDRNDTGNIYEETVTCTVGWRPTCSCGLDPVPCTVLDPFGGSGTVSYVAQRYGRSSIYIDLNPKYRSMAIGRMQPEQPSLVQPYEIVLKEVAS
jgi:DNA modification methylase